MTKKKKSKRLPGGKKNRNRTAKKGNSGLDNKIHDYLSQKTKSGVKPDQLYGYFSKRYSDDKIQNALDRMLKNGKLAFSASGKIKINKSDASNSNIVVGKIDVARSGVGYLIVEGREQDVFIPKAEMGFVLSNDEVKVQLKRKSSGKIEGKILEIVKRHQEEFICHFEPANGFGFAVPMNGNVPFDFFIPETYAKDCTHGDVVLIHVINWDDGDGKNPVAKIVEKMTGLSDNELEMRSILLENGFNWVFPVKVSREADAIPETLDKAEVKKRLDYRKVLTFTIDPHDAKDFDDAISITKLDSGLMQVGVHIADVSHYVRPGSALDKEAQNRATSVYLPDRVCPMLPEKLSNGVCSLRPNEDKFVFSVLFDVNDKMKIVNYRFAKSVIHSDKRFAYEDVQEILEKGEGVYASELQYLDRLAKKLRKDRFDNGAINFETEEVRFKLDENQVPIDVYVKERKDAHLLVEDFMLLANTTVAKYLSKLETNRPNFKSVYRVHDKPDTAKLQMLASIAKRFGIQFSFKNEENVRDALNSLMQMVSGKPHLEVLSRLAIRTMAKAEYTTKNIGHYGLSYEHYTHFTSPIRRYPDVLVHRLLEDRMLKKKTDYYTVSELEELCRISSDRERKAQYSERSATKYKQVEYLQGREGEEFDGTISGVIGRGFFVELDTNKCEGFVPIDSFNETFVFEEDQLRLVGTRTRQKFQIGDRLHVKLFKTNLKEKQVELDFVNFLKEENQS